MFRWVIRSKIFIFLTLFIYSTSILATELVDFSTIQFPYQSLVIDDRDVIGELFNEDNVLSYDAILLLLDELERGELEKVCADEDLYKINNFLAFLVSKGILPNTPEEDKEALEQDIQDLLMPFVDDVIYEKTSYKYGNYLIVQCIYRDFGDVVLCKSWFSKSWKKTKKFVKKHKKAIIIGTAIAIAGVAIVIAAPSAGAAVAGAAATATGAATDSHGNSDKEETSSNQKQDRVDNQPEENITKDQALKMLDDQITDYQKIISENNLLSLDSREGDNERILGSILAHESLSVLPRGLYEGHDELLTKGHGIIDNAFSTNQTASYLTGRESSEKTLQENMYYYQGQQAFKRSSYDRAIEDFGKVLDLNPSNSNVYLDRAYTYFEMGDAENSLKDFQKYNELQGNSANKSISFDDCIDFSFGVINGIPKGAVESGAQLLKLASETIAHPINTGKNIYDGFSGLAKLVKNQEWGILSQTLAPEVCDLVNKWDDLSMKERGERSGYIVGKYGADVLLPTAAAKVVSQGVKGAKELLVIAKNLEKTEKLIPLEALAYGGKNSGGFIDAVHCWKTTADVIPHSSVILKTLKNSKPITNGNDILNLLKPNGKWLGKEGTKNYIRVFEGGEREASRILQELVKTGNFVKNDYPGKMYVLRDGTRVGFRASSTSGPPTIDIDILGYKNNIKIKFVGE